MGSPALNVARTIPRSAVNGPGERFVVWLQGCSLRCPGCWNPDTWAHLPRTLVRPSDLAATVLATQGIEGITLTGGEPFEQAGGLVPLVERVRADGLTVMAFTGFELEELAAGCQRSLLALCDVVVAGRYRREARSPDLAWRGSANQKVHFLTDRYGPAPMPSATSCEVHIRPDGSMDVTGFPLAALLESLRDATAVKAPD
jgi:anaerobic ribonucleoside-triphosphate reductase activating protein